MANSTPSGIVVFESKRGTRVEIRPDVWTRVVYVLLWLALAGYTILESFSAGTFGGDSAYIPIRYLWIMVAVATLFVVVTLLKRTVLLVNATGISVS